VPLLMQSLVSYLNVKLFLFLYDSGYEPIFDIHDEVITAKPVDMEIVNRKMIEYVQEIIDLQKFEFEFSPKIPMIEIKKLEFD